MHAGDMTLVEDFNPRSDEAFQKLLLRFSAAAAKGTDASALIRMFCHETREFFQVTGVYFWQSLSSDELVGAEADGRMQIPSSDNGSRPPKAAFFGEAFASAARSS
jgi:hypothetical protein